MTPDLQHVKLLSVFHYILAGFSLFFGCWPIFYLVAGIAILTGRFNPEPNDPNAQMTLGMLTAGVAGAAIIAMWGSALLMFCAGRSLQKHRRHTFCVVAAGLECLLIPLGTVLGVFTIFVLLRPSVRLLFDENERAVAFDADG